MNALTLFAAVNEDIKKVVQAANRMTLTSFNAMFSSRQAGQGAAGFTRVTGQLREFSGALTRNMTELQTRVDRLVFIASEMQRQTRFWGINQRAVHAADRRWKETCETMSQRSRHLVDRRVATLLEQEAHLMRELDSAIRNSQVGESLAVMAKVEAGQSAANDERLGQVSDEVADLASEIGGLLVTSRNRLRRGSMKKNIGRAS